MNKKKLLSGPYFVWMILFTIIPLLVIAWYGFTDRTGAFTLANVRAIAGPEHLKALGLSLSLSIACTILCLLIAYPLAMILKKSGMGKKGFVVFIFILPMWMNFLLRTLAWQTLLEKNGVINSILAFFHLPGISIINTPGAIILGMVYNFLPFMVLPIYTALIRIDYSLVEAALDLGASPLKAFFKVVFPDIVPGVFSGFMMAFTMSLDDFIITHFTKGAGINTLSTLIYSEVRRGIRPSMYALSTVIFVVVLVVLLIANFRKQPEKD